MEKISRNRAWQLGKSDYFTGKPCTRGHVSPRRVNDWRCRECAREDARMYASSQGKPSTVGVKVRVPREHRALITAVAKMMRENDTAALVIAQLPEALKPHLEQVIKDMGGTTAK